MVVREPGRRRVRRRGVAWHETWFGEPFHQRPGNRNLTLLFLFGCVVLPPLCRGGTLRPMSIFITHSRIGKAPVRHGPARSVAALMVGVGLVVMAVGCTKPLLSPNEPRSQYSRYDLVRGRFAPQYIEDEFGRKMPNLRGRLLLAE